MTQIAFFGHDAGDAAVRRRVRAFTDDGLDVQGFMMRRDADIAVDWPNVDLGRTFDGAYGQRVRAVFQGGAIAARHEDTLAKADLIYARNLDMLAAAFLAKRRTGLKTPVIYESLDVHRLLTRNDPIGFAFRRLEGALVKRSAAVVVSSPAFLRNHFDRRHKGVSRRFLVENRMDAAGRYPERPAAKSTPANRPLRIGWFGILRCARSLSLLMALADHYPNEVEIVLHGKPSERELPPLEPEVEARANVRFGGAYKMPEDLARIYGDVDVVWAGDFMEAGFNSLWLLPNRLYEGGYFNTPPIAPAGTETAAWIEDRGCGFVVAEDLETNLRVLIAQLRAEPERVSAKSATLADLDRSVFVQPRGEMRAIIDEVMAEAI